jgi:hypothetical protein
MDLGMSHLSTLYLRTSYLGGASDNYGKYLNPISFNQGTNNLWSPLAAANKENRDPASTGSSRKKRTSVDNEDDMQSTSGRATKVRRTVLGYSTFPPGRELVINAQTSRKGKEKANVLLPLHKDGIGSGDMQRKPSDLFTVGHHIRDDELGLSFAADLDLGGDVDGDGVHNIADVGGAGSMCNFPAGHGARGSELDFDLAADLNLGGGIDGHNIHDVEDADSSMEFMLDKLVGGNFTVGHGMREDELDLNLTADIDLGGGVYDDDMHGMEDGKDSVGLACNFDMGDGVRREDLDLSLAADIDLDGGVYDDDMHGMQDVENGAGLACNFSMGKV